MFRYLAALLAVQLSFLPIAVNSAGLKGRQTRTEIVHQFTGTAWVENIAVRSNGELLLNIMTPGTLYSLDPAGGTPTVVHEFGESAQLFGITEVTADLFAVVSSTSVWKVDFNSSPPAVENVANITESEMLNGIAQIPGTSIVFVADSISGVVYRLNVDDGAYEQAFDYPELSGPPGGDFSIGVNGLLVRDGYLYWTNTNGQALYRVQITETGAAADEVTVETVADLGVTADDFDLDEAGNAYIATSSANLVIKATPDGVVSTVAGGSDQLLVAGSCSCAFGRGENDSETLYVVTNGAQPAPVGGQTEPGKVVAIDTAIDAVKH